MTSNLVNDRATVTMSGHLHIDVLNADGEIVSSYDRHNRIMYNTAILLARFFSGLEGTGLFGAKYMEFGSGQTVWDTTTPSPNPADVALTTAVLRKATVGNTYLDTSGGETSTPTNIARLKASIASTDSAFLVREVGLFGGTATTTLGSGNLICKVHFPQIPHNAAETLNCTYDLSISVTAISLCKTPLLSRTSPTAVSPDGLSTIEATAPL